MMAGEIQEPFNLSLLDNSIYSGSVSFGRFEKESLSWEKRSSFSQNRYLEEAEKFSKPGSVSRMRAHFEAHFTKKGIQFPSSVEAQTWRKVVYHKRTCNEKNENLWENTSQFGDSCVSYEDMLVKSDDDDDHIYIALKKTEIGHNEDEIETKSSSSATRSNPFTHVQKKSVPNSAATKATNKKPIVLTKGSSASCNTKTSIDTKRQNLLKPKRIAKTIGSQAPTTSKKTESLTPLMATRERRTTTNDFCFRTNEGADKRKVEVRKDLNFKARPIPKSTQIRPQHTLTCQAKARDDHSSKAGCDRLMANGMAKKNVKSKTESYEFSRSK